MMPTTEPPRRVRPVTVALAFVVLYGLTIPWYLRRDWIEPSVWAFPAWALIPIAGSVAIGAFAAFVYLFAWPDEPPPPAGEPAASTDDGEHPAQ
jgi:hypothetical protein